MTHAVSPDFVSEKNKFCECEQNVISNLNFPAQYTQLAKGAKVRIGTPLFERYRSRGAGYQSKGVGCAAKVTRYLLTIEMRSWNFAKGDSKIFAEPRSVILFSELNVQECYFFGAEAHQV
jgi:hypothetical protein